MLELRFLSLMEMIDLASLKYLLLGGIFHEDNYEAEIAFRNAIIRENMYNQRVEFIPIVKLVDRDDSFKAQKIGAYFFSILSSKLLLRSLH